jgi:hypothetical protein
MDASRHLPWKTPIYMDMGIRCLATISFVALLSLGGCGYRETPQEHRQDANSAAGKVGQAAHKVAVEAGKATRAVGRQLDKAAHDAHEGWKEAERKDDARH